MLPRAPRCAALTMALLAAGACRRPRPETHGRPTTPAPVVTIHSAELPAPARAGTIEAVAVPADRPVLAVVGARPQPIVYLHGMCSEPRSDLEAWGNAASELGTVVALEGDVPCPDRGGRTFTQDVGTLDGRIDAAVHAVDASRGLRTPLTDVILVGESLGASRALALAHRFPAKYTRLVLVGGPLTPSPQAIRDVRAVALLAGDAEPQAKMRDGAEALAGAGIPARFWELGGATHGNYGPDGARTMREAIAFVADH